MNITSNKVSKALAKSIYKDTYAYKYFGHYYFMEFSFQLIWINEVHCVDNMHGFPQLLTSSISSVSWAMRTYLFVLGSSRKWAQLTLVTPAPAPIAAAFWLCDQITAAGRHLTHCLQYFCKAEPLSVVWNDKAVSQGASMPWIQHVTILIFKLHRTITTFLLCNNF